MDSVLMDGRCHLAHSRGRVGEMGHRSWEYGEGYKQRGSRGLWEEERKARQGREESALHFHSLGVRSPGGLCNSGCVPSHIEAKAQLPWLLPCSGNGLSLRSRTTGTLSLGEDKEKTHGKERDPGQKRPQECDSRKRGGEEEFEEGETWMRRSKGSSPTGPTLPPTNPMSAKYCCFLVRPKVGTVSAHNPGEGASLSAMLPPAP